ncbi:MAG: tetratricopeptide repeat protein, partial [Gammaproteobacteria bacterium]|nr:tetratricopeptide repeat protein [Gammaproteobacteria bacterium]
MPTDLSGDIEGLVADGDLATADRRCVESLQNDPQNHEALYWRGIVRMQAGQLQEALAYLQGAIEIAPDVPAYHANRGRCLAQNRQTKQAVQAARRALALDPGDALTLDTIGVIFSVAGEHAEAVAALERAVQIDPHRAPYWYNLGASRKYNGDFTGAEDAYRNALRLQPDMDKASAALAHLRRQQPDADQVDNLRVRLQNFAGDINDEMRLRYALAKALDDIGDAAGAFTELDTAAGKWRAAHPYDFSEDAAVFDALLSGIDAAAVSAATPGYANNEPVFIVGMPRTGTTLTERIV